MVYPSSASLLTLMSEVLIPGRMSASLALSFSCLDGSSVLYVAWNLVSSGRYTSLFDFPFFGRFMFSGTKFDVPRSLSLTLSVFVSPFIASICLISCVQLVVLWWYD